jgi:hypothetical protein
MLELPKNPFSDRVFLLGAIFGAMCCILASSIMVLGRTKMPQQTIAIIGGTFTSTDKEPALSIQEAPLK